MITLNVFHMLCWELIDFNYEVCMMQFLCVEKISQQ